MITIIQNYNIEDVGRELKRMLDEGSKLPEVRQLALKVAYSSDQVSAIYDFVKAEIKYQLDPYQTELFIHPRKMIEFYNQGIGSGDCDDISLFTASLLRSLGYQANIVLLDTRGQGFDHAVTQVILNGNTIMLDASTNKYPLGWEETHYQKVVI